MRLARLGVALLAALAACALLAPAAPGATQRSELEIDARAWALIDARSGELLASRAARRRLPVASTTKLMTAYVARRELPLRRVVRAAPYEAIYGESLLGLGAGERISVRDLLYGLILRSGNDAAHALAVAAAGSEERFVREMNRYAAALGLPDTHYANPIGLDEPGNYSSARDLLTLSQRLLRDPVFARIADSRSALLRSLRPPERIHNRNDLLYLEPWATGVKTGHTFDAGYVLVGSGSRRGTSLIAAVLGAPSEESRFADTLELLEYGFSQYRLRRPVRAGEDLANPEIRYSGGRLPLRAARSVALGVRRGQRVTVRVRAPATVEGPIRRGARLGRATVYVDGMRTGTVPLRAGRSIPAASAFDRARDVVESNLVPIATGLFVILMGAALLLRRLTSGNDRGARTRVNAK